MPAPAIVVASAPATLFREVTAILDRADRLVHSRRPPSYPVRPWVTVLVAPPGPIYICASSIAKSTDSRRLVLAWPGIPTQPIGHLIQWQRVVFTAAIGCAVRPHAGTLDRLGLVFTLTAGPLPIRDRQHVDLSGQKLIRQIPLDIVAVKLTRQRAI